ncbi:MAG TPA: hypothetical protein VHY22_05485 [Chthoniobacteraceae bacterium]|jgi:hypothetical protein|nr:hypothetical protein [Chthoniobacteraceae bacterium]
MNLLKSKRAWLRLLNKRCEKPDHQPFPEQYPCFVYFTVRSFGYEQESANFLYPNDLARMAHQLESARSNLCG